VTGLPSFETERLLIRPRRPADLEACLAMDRDPQVTRFIPGPWAEPERHRAFVTERIRRAYPPGLGYWTVLAKNGEFLGWVLLLPLGEAGQVEIGWRLVRAAWGHGYATEAARCILGHALALPTVTTVVADIDAENAASHRVARKLGMRCTDRMRTGGRQALRYAAWRRGGGPCNPPRNAPL